MPKLTRFQPKSFAEQEEELNKRVKEEVIANPIINNTVAPAVPETPVEVPSPTPAEPVKNKGGRKKSNRSIKRENGLTIFLEDAHNEALNNLRGTDKQEVIRVALDQFITRYYRNGRFTPDAYDAIFDYIDRTTFK